MNPGLLDRLITIKIPLTTRGSAGGLTPGSSLDVEVWARKEDRGGMSSRAAGMLLAETTTLFTIRWRSDITEACELECEGRRYDIVSLAEQGRRELLLIQARGRRVAP